MIANGEYPASAAQNFVVDRPQCQNTPDDKDSDPASLSLALVDFSGVFLVQAIGIVGGLVAWFLTRTVGFAHVQVKKSAGRKLKPGEDVGCLQYYFRATEPPSEELSEELSDDVKAIHDIRTLLDKLEHKVKGEANEAAHKAKQDGIPPQKKFGSRVKIGMKMSGDDGPAGDK